MGEVVQGSVWREPVSFAREVEQALERQRDPRFDGVDDEALEESVRVGAAEIAAATCRWLLAVAELVVRGIWAQQGARSPAEWLSWAVSMAPSTAREHVRVALRLSEFPATTERFAVGLISYSKVRAITRLRLPELEQTLLSYAEFATAAQLDAIVAGMCQVARATRDRPDEVFDRRSCRWRWTDDAMVRITVDLPPDEGMAAVQRLERTVDARIHAERQRPHDGPYPDAPAEAADHPPPRPTREQRRADVLADALRLVADGDHDRAGAEVTVVVHVDAADLTTTDDDGDRLVPVRASAGARTPLLSARAVRRLACDARLALITHDDGGEPSGVSGTTRRVPPRLKRLLYARDQGCRFPSCTADRGLHAHHIIHWADDGPTELSNLVLLCAYHHRFVHDRGWTIIHDGLGHLRFRPPTQDTIPTVAPSTAVDPYAVIERNRHDDVAPRPAALQPVAATNRADIDACVWVLCDRLRMLQPPTNDLTAVAA